MELFLKVTSIGQVRNCNIMSVETLRISKAAGNVTQRERDG